jgi:hypothetical protein
MIPVPASSKITADDRKKLSKRSCLETLKTINRLDIEDLEADAPVRDRSRSAMGRTLVSVMCTRRLPSHPSRVLVFIVTLKTATATKAPVNCPQKCIQVSERFKNPMVASPKVTAGLNAPPETGPAT